MFYMVLYSSVNSVLCVRFEKAVPLRGGKFLRPFGTKSHTLDQWVCIELCAILNQFLQNLGAPPSQYDLQDRQHIASELKNSVAKRKT